MKSIEKKRLIRHALVGLVGLIAALAINVFAVTTSQADGPYSIDSNLNEVVDVTGSQLDAAIRSIRSDSGLIGLGQTFVDVARQHGINAYYVAAHAAWESTWGTSPLARGKNNLFGYGAYDRCPYTCAWTFPSKADSVKTVMAKVKAEYLTPGGANYHGATLRGMNVNYATDQNWKNGIASIMNSLYARAPHKPTTPSNLSANGASTSQIKLTWRDNSNDEQGFKVERRTGFGWLPVTTTGASVISYTEGSLNPGTQYCYRVYGFNSAGNSGYSNETCATTLRPPTPTPGRLQVVESLRLSTTSPRRNELVTVRFKVKNVGGQALAIQELGAGARLGRDWNGSWADFPHVYNITLQPGQEYVYEQRRTFTTAGNYFAEPVVKLGGNWGGIANANRVAFTVANQTFKKMSATSDESFETMNVDDLIVPLDENWVVEPEPFIESTPDESDMWVLPDLVVDDAMDVAE